MDGDVSSVIPVAVVLFLRGGEISMGLGMEAVTDAPTAEGVVVATASIPSTCMASELLLLLMVLAETVDVEKDMASIRARRRARTSCSVNGASPEVLDVVLLLLLLSLLLFPAPPPNAQEAKSGRKPLMMCGKQKSTPPPPPQKNDVNLVWEEEPQWTKTENR